MIEQRALTQEATFPPVMAHGPLDGVKVLDLSEDIAGSFCARLLADYGAEVLKLEPPAGAALRRMPPFFGDDPHPEKSLFFLAMNLNKKSATINLKTAGGRELFRELIPHIDVVVESYKPGYLEELGLGYEALETINPGLVLTSITPFGQTGPYSQYAGEEIVNYAMGLIMSISGRQDREPLKHGGFQAQYEGGLNGAAATAMALFMQGNTGEGQHIDVSITECVASTMMATQSMYPFIGATQPRRRASGSNFGHPMACEDGWIIVQTGGGATWETIANFFRDPRLHEERFTDTAERKPERRGAGPHRAGVDQRAGQVGPVHRGGQLADAVRAGADAFGAGGVSAAGVAGLLPRGGPSGDREDQGAGGAVQPVANAVPVPDAGADAGAAQPGDLRGRAGLLAEGSVGAAADGLDLI